MNLENKKLSILDKDMTTNPWMQSITQKKQKNYPKYFIKPDLRNVCVQRKEEAKNKDAGE